MLTIIIGVVVLLGGLIFFHEFGHYSVAKLFGVKVEVFSLGFGKKIFKRKWGETEYCLSLVPLGGYVKLMGDDPYKEVPANEAHRAFSTQKLYRRFLIVAAGPLFNLILAYLLFMIVFWVGLPVASTKIGATVVGSPAWEAGLRAGDKIETIFGQNVGHWSELEELVVDKAHQKTTVVVDRIGKRIEIPITISEVQGKNVYGEDTLVGRIRGIQANPLAPKIGISNFSSSAYQAGLRTGDVIKKIGTTPVQTFTEVQQTLNKIWESGTPVTLTLSREDNGKTTEHSFSVVFPKKPNTSTPMGVAEGLGIYPSEVFVEWVNPGSPSEQAGLLVGDRIVKIGNNSVFNFESIVDAVQDLGEKGQPIAMQVEREGKLVSLNMSPIKQDVEDPITREKTPRFMVGFRPQTLLQQADMTLLQIRNPVQLVTHSVTETNRLAKRMLVSLGKLVMGKISVKNLGGPVLIASVAGKSLDAGLIPFLQMMALISINLFLLNLFPIPILDGGHLLFFIVEALKGSPVSVRTMEIANQLGMVFILMLVGLTLFNDISRIVN